MISNSSPLKPHIAPHDISVILILAGEEPSYIDSVGRFQICPPSLEAIFHLS